ncbi:hypothetical protein THRCLA_09672, partial [Thraustotheca clavata]
MRFEMSFMILIVLVQLMALNCSALHAVIHAQAHSSSDGYVIGSEMTCSGFEHAFKDQGHVVQLMYPGNYSTIADYQWDIVFIEGWFPAIIAFIHEIRRQTNGHAKVYFFCLDPDFPGLDVIQKLDVDAFFTNSYEVLDILKPHAPHAEFMLLAANEPRIKSSIAYTHQNPIVFVGNAVGIMTKKHLPEMLREAIPFGLTIYGYAWDMHPEFAPYWAGVLPQEDLFVAYSKAKVILGATMDGQRAYGMINNRVFEALMAGKIFITDYYEALETVFQDRILYYKKDGDVTRLLTQLSHTNFSFQYPSIVLKEFISSQHTYHDRARQITNFYNKFGSIHLQRLNIPKILVAIDNDYLSKNILSSLFVYDVLLPAFSKLHERYHVEVISIESLVDSVLYDHDMVLLISIWGSSVEQNLRAMPKLKHCYGLFLLGRITDSQIDEYIALSPFYDIVYYTTPRDYDQLSQARTNVQHAFGWPSAHVKVNNFSCDTLIIGDWNDDNQRLVNILEIFPQDKASSVHLVLPLHHQAILPHTISFLNKWGFIITFAVPGMQLLSDLIQTHNCRALLLPSAIDTGGSDYILASGVAMGRVVNILDDNARLVHLFKDLTAGKPLWDINHVATMIELGKSRPLCMGRGNASVTMVKPLEPAIPGQFIDIYFQLHNFRVPYDGSVCLFVNDQSKTCVFHDDMFFHLELPFIETNITLYLGLRSMLYADTFALSTPTSLVWATDSMQATCATKTTSQKYKH